MPLLIMTKTRKRQAFIHGHAFLSKSQISRSGQCLTLQATATCLWRMELDPLKQHQLLVPVV